MPLRLGSKHLLIEHLMTLLQHVEQCENCSIDRVPSVLTSKSDLRRTQTLNILISIDCCALASDMNLAKSPFWVSMRLETELSDEALVRYSLTNKSSPTTESST